MSLASDLNALSRASPFPDSAAPSTPSEPTAHRAPDVDGPDYVMRWKFAIPAYLLELRLSAGVVAGAYFFATKYALDQAQLWPRREPQPATVPVEAAVEKAAILGGQRATRAADTLRHGLTASDHLGFVERVDALAEGVVAAKTGGSSIWRAAIRLLF